MNKICITLLLMLCHPLSWCHATDTAEQISRLTPEQLAAAETEYTMWFNQLNEQLLASEDSYAMSMGLAAILNGTLRDQSKQPKNPKTTNMLTSQIAVLNGIIGMDTLSNETLDLLAGLCFKAEIINQCDQDTLLDKQLKQNPDNLNVYLIPLKLAAEDNDHVLVNKIINLMAQSKISHSSRYITTEFNQKIDTYVEAHPIPKSAITAFKDDKALLAGVSDEIKANIDQRIKAYFPASIKMSYIYLFNAPAHKTLYDICKSKPDLFEQCLKITQVLINDSNAIPALGLGYVILMAMHENMGKTELLKAVQAKQEQYKTTIKCLSEATQANHFMDTFLDSNYQRINLLPVAEIKKLELLADYVYQKHKSTNSKQINPATCYPA